MIIGTGDIGTFLIERNLDRDDVIFFASGVSNSSCRDFAEFEREFDLLLQQDRSKHFVYFSSLCIYYSNTAYAYHKKSIEEVIKKRFQKYTIIRLGNISWGINPNTLINFLTNKIKNNEDYLVQDVYRFIVDEKEFEYWIRLIPVGQKNEMNIPGNMAWVPDIVYGIKHHLALGND